MWFVFAVSGKSLWLSDQSLPFVYILEWKPKEKVLSCLPLNECSHYCSPWKLDCSYPHASQKGALACAHSRENCPHPPRPGRSAQRSHFENYFQKALWEQVTSLALPCCPVFHFVFIFVDQRPRGFTFRGAGMDEQLNWHQSLFSNGRAGFYISSKTLLGCVLMFRIHTPHHPCVWV